MARTGERQVDVAPVEEVKPAADGGSPEVGDAVVDGPAEDVPLAGRGRRLDAAVSGDPAEEDVPLAGRGRGLDAAVSGDPAEDGPPVPQVAATAPAGRIALEDERDFCLRSLRDLEAEWEAGDIDEADYQALKDSYTARAAAALHALDGRSATDGVSLVSGLAGHSPEGASPVVAETSPAGGEASSGAGGAGPAVGEAIPAAGEASSVAGEADPVVEDARSGGADASSPARRRRANPRRRTAIIALCVVAAAAAAAWAVVASSATRLPGQEITGAALGPEALAQSLQQAQQAADKGDDLTAVKDYQKILNSDPNQTEALTGEGWLLAQTGEPTILQQGLTMLQQAERADPTYAPAHVYRGIALMSEGDYTNSIPELKWYLAHSPDPQLAPQVRTALQEAEAKAAAAAKK